jgi:hypothetical protein
MNENESVWKPAWLGAALALTAIVALPTASLAGGTVKGKATYTGAPPAPTKLAMDADPVCAAAHTTPVMSEEIVVKDGGLQNVFVYLTGAPSKAPADHSGHDRPAGLPVPPAHPRHSGRPAAADPEQRPDAPQHPRHAQEEPAVQLRDAEVRQEEGNQVRQRRDDGRGEVRRPSLDEQLHRRLDHPYFAVSGPDRTFTIADVPAGEYPVKAWHEKLGEKEGKVKVDGATATIDYTFGS